MEGKVALRKQVKSSKPRFVVKESKFTSGVKKRWRYPRGKHSSVRQRHKGRPALPTTGYMGPKESRGLHPTGLEVVYVQTLADVEKIDSKTQGALISANVGNRKRLLLLQSVAKAGVKLLNAHDADAFSKNIAEKFDARKAAKKEKSQSKEKKDEVKKKKAKEKEQKEKEEKKEQEAETVDEKQTAKKEEEKDLAEKLITKRQ